MNYTLCLNWFVSHHCGHRFFKIWLFDSHISIRHDSDQHVVCTMRFTGRIDDDVVIFTSLSDWVCRSICVCCVALAGQASQEMWKNGFTRFCLGALNRSAAAGWASLGVLFHAAEPKRGNPKRVCCPRRLMPPVRCLTMLSACWGPSSYIYTIYVSK